VIFGDACPHPANYCPSRFDFFEITKSLYNKNITINSVFCRKYSQSELQKLGNIRVGDFSTRPTHNPATFFSWIANVTGGMIIGIDKVEDLLDVILAAAAKDSGHLDDLEEKLKTTAPNKLKLIEIARNAEQRKKLGGNNLKRLT
jgi:hypothetical protein